MVKYLKFGIVPIRDNIFNSTVSLGWTQINNLAVEMLAPDFAKSVSSLFQNPADFLSSAYWYPLATSDHTEEERKLTIGNYECKDVKGRNTLIGAKLYNLGHIFITGTPLNSLLDPKRYYAYDGFSNLSIYLPYLGWVDVSINSILASYERGKPLLLLFRLAVDYRSGQGCYYIFTSQDIPTAGSGGNEHIATKDDMFTNDRDLNLHYVASFTTQIGMPVALASSNMIQMYRTMVEAGVKVAGGAIMAGVTASKSASDFASTSTTTTSSTRTHTGRTKRGAERGERSKQLDKIKYEKTSTTTTDGVAEKRRAVEGAAKGTVEDSASVLSALNYSGNVERVNSCNLFDGFTKNIVIIVKQPKLNEEDTYNNYKNNAKIFGLPYGKFDSLNTVHGLTFISDIHLEDMGDTVTSEELVLIEEALKSGVILP